jgi:uncharacterized tellurite resistance protein B-like protein
MDISLIDYRGMNLISKMAGKEISTSTLTPTMLFLAALVTILLGVVMIDGSMTDAEWQHLQSVLNALVPSGGPGYPLRQQLLQTTQRHQIYLNPYHVSTLVMPLSESERLLLLGLGYEMARADGELNTREIMFLRAIAKRMQVTPRHLASMEACFIHHQPPHPAVLEELKKLLAPSQIQSINVACTHFATNILSVFNTIPAPIR